MEQWEHQPPEERFTVRVERGGKPVGGVRCDCITSIDEEVMYWRKANHIHKWFVDNVQDGIDDCRSYEIEWHQVQELADVCGRVMDASKLIDGMIYAGTVYNKEHPGGQAQRTPGKVIEDATVAKELLPTRVGCFFGCTDYDEDYLNEVIRTHQWAGTMLFLRKGGTPGNLMYSSSW